MKRILSAVMAACVAFVACENLDLSENPESSIKDGISTGPSGANVKDSVVFKASLEPQTKTYMEYLNGVYKLRWAENDKIMVWDASTLADGASAKYEYCTLLDGEGTSSAEFVGTIEAQEYVALYAAGYYVPYNQCPAIDIPVKQYRTREDGIDDYTYPMVAVSSTRDFNFENICSIIKLSITGNGEALRYITVFSEEIMAGPAAVELDDYNKPVLQFLGSDEEDGVYSWIDLYCDDVILSEIPTDCYIVVPAQTYESGLGFYIGTSDGSYMQVYTSEHITTERSRIHEVDPISFTPEEVPLEDGVYVVGKATGVNIPLNAPAEHYKMVPDELRNGRYEKYLPLFRDENFSIVKWEDGRKTEYGGVEISSKSNSIDDGMLSYEYKWYSVAADEEANWYFSVDEDGLYHIIIDLNEPEDLDCAQIALFPVDWNVRGTYNNWGATPMEMESFSVSEVVYSLQDVYFTTAGGLFKFEYTGIGWYAGEVSGIRTPSNLGMTDGALWHDGPDIKLGLQGIYDIELRWRSSDDEFATSCFSYSFELKQELSLPDYTGCPMELVGTSVAYGDPDTSDWGWGRVLLADNDGYPSVYGSTYTWTWSNVYLYNEADCEAEINNCGFKARTVGNKPYGEIDAWEVSYNDLDLSSSASATACGMSNILVEETGSYNVTLSLDASTGQKTITLVSK